MISKNTCLMGNGVYINPEYHVVPLSKLKIKKLNRLWYLHVLTDSKPMIFHMGQEFKKSFCKFLHVSTKATKNIPFDVLLETMKENNSFDVKIYVNKGRALALAVMKAEHTPLGADGALELYEWLEYHGYDVRDLLQDEFFTEFSIFNKNPFDLDGFHSYRGGGLIHVSHVGNSSVKILTTLEHRNSRNYAIVNNKSLCLYVPTRKKKPMTTLQEAADVLTVVANSDKPEFYQILLSQLRAAEATTASVRECVAAGKLLVDAGCADRANQIELVKILDHYNLASPDEKNEQWLTANPTHLTRLRLFHILVGALPKNKRKFREQVGDFLFVSGDLEGSGRGPIWGEPECDDSDIVSDIDAPLEDTEIYEEDDIVSDFGD